MSATARPRTASSSGWWGSLWRPWPVVVLAGLVRLALVCWAEYQDAFLPVNYTDIDYAVFTDAARFVAAGGSPYQRSTFRYSPLLAYLMLPNIWLHPAWGKAAVLLAVAVRYHEDLPTAWLLQTWSFVALNKVITAQYFVWFLSLLPLTLPALVAQRTVSARAMGAASLFWVVAQLHWLGWAYALEMQGLSVHVGVWAAGLGFLAANTAAVALLLRALQPRLHGATTFMDASLKLCQPRPAHAIALASKKHN